MTPQFRRTLLYFGAVVFGQGVSFLLLPVVTRFLAPEAYGQYTLALTVSNLVAMFGAAWIRNVGMRLYYEAVERRGTRGFFVATTALQTLLFSVLYTGTVAVLHFTGAELAPLSVMVAAGATALVGALFAYVVTLLRAEERTGSFAVAEIGAGLLRVVFTVGGLYAGFVSPELLFHAVTAGYFLAGAFALPQLWRRLTGSARPDVARALELVRIGPKSVPFTLAEWLERLADRLVLDHFLGTAVVGIYSVGYAVGERIVGSVTQAVFMMAWPNILKAWSEGGRETAREAVHDAQRLFAWMTVGPTAFLLVHGDALTRWLAGAEYDTAGSIVGIVAASMWVRAYGSYFNRHLELDKRFGLLSGVTMIGAVLNVGLNFLLVPRFGMLGAAYATLANRLFNGLVFFAIRDRRLVSLRLPPLLASAGLSAALAVASAGFRDGSLASMLVFAVPYGVVALFVLSRGGDGRP